ncbi:MAG TPA: hypothetical protein VKR58_15425 [Aquella sp.]|jgi:hypothetical protein|nr:hypothetical protein [Aquella sp.]
MSVEDAYEDLLDNYREVNEKYKSLLEFMRYHAMLELNDEQIINLKYSGYDDYQKGRNTKEANIAIACREILKKMGELE